MEKAFTLLANELIEDNFKKMSTILEKKHPQKNNNDLYQLGQLWASSYEIMEAFHHKLQQFDADYILIDLSTHFSSFLEREKPDIYDYVKTDHFHSWLINAMGDYIPITNIENAKLIWTLYASFPTLIYANINTRLNTLRANPGMIMDTDCNFNTYQHQTSPTPSMKQFAKNRISHHLNECQNKPKPASWAEPILLTATTLSLIAIASGTVGSGILWLMLSLTLIHGFFISDNQLMKSALTKHVEHVPFAKLDGTHVTDEMVTLVINNLRRSSNMTAPSKTSSESMFPPEQRPLSTSASEPSQENKSTPRRAAPIGVNI